MTFVIKFSAAINELPKPFQEGATRALREPSMSSSHSSEPSSSYSQPQSLPNTSTFSRSKSNVHGKIPSMWKMLKKVLIFVCKKTESGLGI